MSFDQEQVNTPTDIGQVTLSFDDDVARPHKEEHSFTAFDVPESLMQDNLHQPSGVQVVGLEEFVEDTDYSIDYVNGDITALSTGSLALDTGYRVTYSYHHQGGSFALDILDQNNVAMSGRNGNLMPHLTAGEKTTISNFLDTIRQRAFDKIITGA